MGTDAPPLPDDLATCHAMIRELLAALRDARARITELEQRVDQLVRQRYGPRAERADPADPVAAGKAPPPGDALPADPPRPRRGHGRRRLPADLPRQRVEHDLPEAERRCPECGTPRRRIGCEVSEQLDYRPASLVVVEHVRPTYACPHCQEHVATAGKPAQPIDKGLPGPGLLAHVVVSKYADHLPLHRLERIFGRQGVVLARSTLCDWMARAADLLRPLHALLAAQVLASRVLHTDDTPVPVQDRGRDTTRQGRLWVYLGDREHPYTAFDFTPNRRRDGPAAFLGDYTGYLQADAFGGYDGIYATGRVVEVACWAHARRKFYDARPSDPARAAEALARIGRLYAVERAVTAQAEREGLAAEAAEALRRQRRQAEAMPLLTSLCQWLHEQQAQVLPKSPLGQAVAYALNQWAALARYVEAGYLAIDNNAAERALRAIAVGRKNWLFAGSDAGGRTAAVLCSAVASCQRHRLDPFAYLRDLLTRLPELPAARLGDLLPDRWAAARAAEAAALAADPIP